MNPKFTKWYKDICNRKSLDFDFSVSSTHNRLVHHRLASEITRNCIRSTLDGIGELICSISNVYVDDLSLAAPGMASGWISWKQPEN